jgi:chromobox protein 5
VSSVDSAEFEYQVEKILDDKIINGERRYLVKWEGYSIKEATWETAKSFANPDAILKSYKMEKMA